MRTWSANIRNRVSEYTAERESEEPARALSRSPQWVHRAPHQWLRNLWVTESLINYEGRPVYTVSIMEFEKENAGAKHSISATHLMRHPGVPNGSSRLDIRSKLPLLSDFPRGCNEIASFFGDEPNERWFNLQEAPSFDHCEAGRECPTTSKAPRRDSLFSSLLFFTWPVPFNRSQRRSCLWQRVDHFGGLE
jgi:hypothetical protein